MSALHRATALALLLGSLSPTATWSAGPSQPAHASPSKLEAIPGTSLKRVTLTERAARRLDIGFGDIRIDPSGRTVVPYAAVLYDPVGDAWVYLNPAPLTYVRHKIVIDVINGEEAVLKDGPPAGSKVVVAGVAELYGTEKGVGH